MKFTLLMLVAVVATLLAPVGFAQTQADTIPIDGPITHVGTYDLVTQTLTPSSATPADGSGVVFDNTVFLGSFFQPGPGSINMDWGTLAAGGFNDITEIEIGYGTEMLGTVDMVIALHTGATGFGDIGSAVSAYTLTGLPGSVSGSPEAFAVTVTLPGPDNLPDGAIGWSYEFLDALTGPLLVGPPNPAGVIDAFDQYLSDTTYVGTFNFGGAPAPLASFYWLMTGETPGPTCQADLGFAGDGAMVLSVCGEALSSPANVAQLVVDGAPAGATVYLIADPVNAPVVFAGGMLVPSGAMLILAASADGAGHFEADVRGSTTSIDVYLQAAAFDGSTPSGKALSNALELAFGP